MLSVSAVSVKGLGLDNLELQIRPIKEGGEEERPRGKADGQLEREKKRRGRNSPHDTHPSHTLCWRVATHLFTRGISFHHLLHLF